MHRAADITQRAVFDTSLKRLRLALDKEDHLYSAGMPRLRTEKDGLQSTKLRSLNEVTRQAPLGDTLSAIKHNYN